VYLHLTALVFATLALGCSTRSDVKAYPGPELPSTELATITATKPSFFSTFFGVGEKHLVYIAAVDGVTVVPEGLFKGSIRTAFVKPGEHTVAFGFRSPYSGQGPRAPSGTPTTLRFEAEAGKTYELHALEVGSFGKRLLAALTLQGRWQGWITEKETGRVVAGADPRQPQDPEREAAAPSIP
jgi:hypothetical protein